jgi:transcriptional regulator GlxA family with amidase domain
MRVEAARRRLERSDDGLKQVAAAAGFGSVLVMRRAFVRLLGITPRRYRDLADRTLPVRRRAQPVSRSSTSRHIT